MKLFVAVLVVALFAANQAFFVDDLKNLVDTVKDKVLPTLVQTGLTTLVGSLVGKRDAEMESLALLEDTVLDKNEKVSQMKTFLQKLGEARKAGNVKEFLQKHMEEQKKKYLERLTPEQRQKYEEHVKKVQEAHSSWKSKMEEYKKKVESCRAAVKTAQEAAAKTADKTDGSRRDLFKVYMDCMKPSDKKTEEKKTQEDVSSFVETLKKFREQFEEAKKNGKLQEFLKTHHENLKTKLTEARQKMLDRMTAEQKQRFEEHKQKMAEARKTMEDCKTKATAMKDASKLEQMKAYVKCLRDSKKTDETKTQEDFRRMTAEERAEFKKKYEEAKKAGKLREFLENHRKEQKAKMEAAKKEREAKVAECKTKYEEAKKTDDKLDMRTFVRNCMMTDNPTTNYAKMQACREEVKKAMEEAKAAKKPFSRKDGHEVFMKCMKPDEKKTEEKTQEDSRRMTAEERAEFKKQYEEAKKAGNLKEFLENYRKEQKAKMEAAKKKKVPTATLR